MEIILALFLSCILLLVGFIFGRMEEKKHYASIVAREERLKHILIFNEKLPPGWVAGQPFYLVDGSVVISGDRFKQFVAGLKQLFGGHITSYESMLDRGRREAILRMKESAHRYGASMIFNVHLQTAVLADNNNRKGQLVCAEILAYGTAWAIPENSY